MKANRSQIAKIHIAKKQLGIDDSDYRGHLAEYGVIHSNDLEYNQAVDLLKKYESAGFVNQTKKEVKSTSVSRFGFGKNKYEMFADRGGEFATPETLRKIEALWRDASELKTDESLQRFIENKTGISHITFLHHDHAKIIVTALKAMKKQKREK